MHFVVGGRLEQNHNGEKWVSRLSCLALMCFLLSAKCSSLFHQLLRRRFITGEEEVSKLPKDVQKVFTLLTEDDFRVDISSTEIRRQSSSDTSPSM